MAINLCSDVEYQLPGKAIAAVRILCDCEWIGRLIIACISGPTR